MAQYSQTQQQHTLAQLGFATRWSGEDLVAASARDDGLGVREHGRDVGAAGAADVLRKGVSIGDCKEM